MAQLDDRIVVVDLRLLGCLVSSRFAIRFLQEALVLGCLSLKASISDVLVGVRLVLLCLRLLRCDEASVDSFLDLGIRKSHAALPAAVGERKATVLEVLDRFVRDRVEDGADILASLL